MDDGKIGGMTLDELKDLGFAPADIDYIQEQAGVYGDLFALKAMHGPDTIKPMLIQAFESGVAVGIAKVRKMAKVKTIGFRPPQA